jgi:DNA-directed RNA polymerase specialized sigma24 family protein
MSERRADPEPLDELARLLALQIRLSLNSQAQAITELARIGLPPRRIAELLGTSANTVNVSLQKAKKAAAKPKAVSRG